MKILHRIKPNEIEIEIENRPFVSRRLAREKISRFLDLEILEMKLYLQPELLQSNNATASNLMHSMHNMLQSV